MCWQETIYVPVGRSTRLASAESIRALSSTERSVFAARRDSNVCYYWGSSALATCAQDSSVRLWNGDLHSFQTTLSPHPEELYKCHSVKRLEPHYWMCYSNAFKFRCRWFGNCLWSIWPCKSPKYHHPSPSRKRWICQQIKPDLPSPCDIYCKCMTTNLRYGCHQWFELQVGYMS